MVILTNLSLHGYLTSLVTMTTISNYLVVRNVKSTYMGKTCLKTSCEGIRVKLFNQY